MRQGDLGRWPSGLSAQNSDRPSGPYSDIAPAGGLSGFTGARKANTSVRGGTQFYLYFAGLGMAVARDLKGDDFNVVAVIGDGAMSAGMAYEAMNNAGALAE